MVFCPFDHLIDVFGQGFSIAVKNEVEGDQRQTLVDVVVQLSNVVDFPRGALRCRT